MQIAETIALIIFLFGLLSVFVVVMYHEVQRLKSAKKTLDLERIFFEEAGTWFAYENDYVHRTRK